MAFSMISFCMRRVGVPLLCLSVGCLAPYPGLNVAHAASNTIKIVKTEPGAGKLPFGVKVFVDDGTCPAGQIKQMYRASASAKRQKTCVAFKSATPTKMLKKEPGKGQLKAGMIVIVDDGTCPAGKVKQVKGGGKNQGRKTACIAKP